MCDSSVPGRGHGYLDDATLAWLDQALAGAPSDKPAFVCFHHPPVPLHGQYVDPIRQFGEQRLAEVVDRHAHVAALLCGHSQHARRHYLRRAAAGGGPRRRLHAEDAVGGRGRRAARLRAAAR